MNSYQAIEATDLGRLAGVQSAQIQPLHALAEAQACWFTALPWSNGSSLTDQSVLIDRFESGATFLSVLRLWHETHGNSPPENSTNPQPQLTVYALDLNPWTLESLQSYWLGEQQAAFKSQQDQQSGIHPITQDALEWLMQYWPQATPGLHCIRFEPWNCLLWLWFGDTERGLNQITAGLDAAWPHVELSPKAQRQLGALLKPIETPKPVAPHQAAANKPKPLTVAVIGAGIAGSCTAKALCGQGFQVHLLDAADGPAAGASGNWVGAFHPHVTRDDTPLSQLTRLGCEFTHQALESLTRQGLLVKGLDWDTPGHVQTIPTDEVQRTRDTLVQLQFPEQVVQWAEPHTRMPTHLHGLYFPQGAWVKPARWVQANLQACGSRLKVHYQSQIKDIKQLPVLLGFQPDAVVIACAQNSLMLAGVESGRSNSVKGQITRLKRRGDLHHIASGESYAIAPPAEDWMLLGATYERPVGELVPTEASDALNIDRFQVAFPTIELGQHLDSRCAVRFVWADRLPVIGLLRAGVEQGQDGWNGPAVYLNTAYASRGLTWAALAAHRIAFGLRQQAGLSATGLEWKLTDRMSPRI